MALPQGDEYSQAVQNAATSFKDPDLRQCQVETTPLGLPKPYAGGFTTTYRMKGQARQWAARCFTREVRGLDARYVAIGAYVQKHACPFLVQATYLQDGIKAAAKWNPIIKMDWVKGDPLNIFIEKNQQAGVIRDLADKFARLVRQLSANEIAHGDLQHGNILVAGGELVLVDYDGMFLPGLEDNHPDEIGHVNYQHPQRDSSHYSRAVDRFSAIVIYLGLRALALNPALWNAYNNSENILFRQADFVDPDRSALLRDISRLEPIAPFSNRLKTLCKSPPQAAPTLDDFIAGRFADVVASTRSLPVLVPRYQYPVLDAKRSADLVRHVGERIEVIGQITDFAKGTTRFGSPYVFLNFGTYPAQTFTLNFWNAPLDQELRGRADPLSLVGAWVSVTGVIGRYKGKPQMSIEMLSQISVLEDENAGLRRLEDAKKSLLGQLAKRSDDSSVLPGIDAKKPNADRESAAVFKATQASGAANVPGAVFSAATQTPPSASLPAVGTTASRSGQQSTANAAAGAAPGTGNSPNNNARSTTSKQPSTTTTPPTIAPSIANGSVVTGQPGPTSGTRQITQSAPSPPIEPVLTKVDAEILNRTYGSKAAAKTPAPTPPLQVPPLKAPEAPALNKIYTRPSAAIATPSTAKNANSQNSHDSLGPALSFLKQITSIFIFLFFLLVMVFFCIVIWVVLSRAYSV